MNDITTRRFELKMVSTSTPIFQAQSWIRTHSEAFSPAFPTRQVNNIYFDTINLDNFNDHLNGLHNRRKIRCRWYGKQTSTNDFTIEIKEKSGMLGWKSIQKVERTLQLNTMNWSETMRYLHRHTTGTFRETLSKSYPCLINHYKREYYVSADGDTRLTLDSNIISYSQMFSQHPNVNFPIIDPHNTIVIEIKVSDNKPNLSRILSGFPLQTVRYSKFVDAMTKN